VTVRRRLITSTALIALAALLVLGIPLGAVEAARVRSEQTGRLEREADAVAGVLDDRLAHGALTRAELARLVRPGHRVTVTTDGRTLSAGAHLTGQVLTARAGVSNGATVIAAAPSSEVGDRVRRSWLLIAGLGIGGIALATGLAALQARRLSRPLERLARTSAQLGEGDFSVRSPHSGVPEIDAIGHALDTSAGRIAELVAREREFSTNISHQLRTPLTALQLRLEESARVSADPASKEELAAALREADRLEAMIAALLTHARSSTAAARSATDPGAIAADRVASWQPLFRHAHRPLRLAAAPGAPAALASPGTVGQVLDVLLGNALAHGGGPVDVAVAADGRFVRVTVRDGGPGVDAPDRERIFERGASTGDGAGIGLPLARALARADGGTLRLRGGACFELRLRRAAPSAT
jgi:signal transduction histidine kinase